MRSPGHFGLTRQATEVEIDAVKVVRAPARKRTGCKVEATSLPTTATTINLSILHFCYVPVPDTPSGEHKVPAHVHIARRHHPVFQPEG
ncbi:unnamed protein product [Rhizoctonia solani]|uniref:Uncharacterized protein n=1 Tax=Rhizoctonia solani TaxID=456999 RepID=A0A8H3D3D9_9AGAM|nr:unnamed protein product [Rhizoctonia solani]